MAGNVLLSISRWFQEKASRDTFATTFYEILFLGERKKEKERRRERKKEVLLLRKCL